ncbi:4-hydroxythreonine-4-phosphate dehydrogenase [hydrothermal vent metagenome]|uniref:4-hydroxythreonine-4-phosphate dehydrogenase n=1 Tax=hydrothermal vent metagenome TaxID=652676 RepID=A0A3B1DC96_9ZZZZ
MTHTARIAITMGDPAGIGPEIIVNAFHDELSFCQPIVVGSARFLDAIARQMKIPVTVHTITSPDQARFQAGVLDVLDLDNVSPELARGQATAEGGKASVQYIEAAVKLALDQQVSAITTAPINKESIHKAGFFYPGHTELLAKLCGAKTVALMLAGENLRVVLATTHLPLNKVSEQITVDRVLTTIQLTHQWLQCHVTAAPKIAVTGLNPHCGDGGIFGGEEQSAIIPALEAAQKKGIQVEGPFSADALFIRGQFDAYDAVIAMYHDQGMIPIKMDSKGTAVNITLGLPILRTSVDHGTAYDIAGTGTASPESLIIALKKAAELAQSSTVSAQ